MKSFSKIFLLLLLCKLMPVEAQQGVFMEFISKQTDINKGEIARNSIRIVNRTANTYPFLLEYTIPQKWRLLGQTSKTFMLSPGDSLFVPVYLVPQQVVEGGEVAVLGARLFSDGYMVAVDNWMVSSTKIVDWRIIPSSNTFYFLHGSDSVEIPFRIINTGNAEERISFSASSFRNQLHLQSNNQPFSQRTFVLKPESDTSVVLKAAIRRTFNGEKEYDIYTNKQQNETYVIRTEGHNSNEGSLYLADKENVSLNKIYDYYRDRMYSRTSLPLTVELDAYNLLQESTYLSLQLYGNTTLEEVNELSYFYQTNFNSNVFDVDALLGDYFYVGYHTPTYFAEMGNLVLNHEGASVSGKGLKGGYTVGNHNFGGGIVASPSVWDIDKWGAGAYYNYLFTEPNIKTGFYGFFEENSYMHQQNYSVLPEGNWRINKNHMVKVSLGYNLRNYLYDLPGSFTRHGYGARVSYGGRFNRFTLSTVTRYGSPTYEPSPGILQLTGVGGYYHANGLQSRLLLSHFSSRPEVYTLQGTLAQQGLRSWTNQVEYKLSASERKSSLSGSVYVRERFYNTLKMLHEGIGGTYYMRFDDNSRVTASLNTDLNQFPDLPQTGSFFTARFKSSYRFRENFLVSFRYHYGPFYYYEFSDYAATKENPQSIFLNGFYDLWMADNRLLARFSGNYNYRLNRKQHILNTRPELFFFSKNGFRLSTYGNFSYFSRQLQSLNQSQPLSRSTSASFELGFGVRKQLGVPISKKRFFDVEFVAFFDANGNGMKEKDEPALENILVSLVPQKRDDEQIMVEGYKVLTGKEGVARLENIPSAAYHLWVDKLAGGEGFYDNSAAATGVVKDMKVLLPFALGGEIFGSLQVQKAKYTRFEDREIDVANIRVVALSESGKEYSTLTDKKGHFSLKVPSGKYTVTLNYSAFGDGFSIQENGINVVINEKQKNTFVGFFVTESERRLNIKKF